jgi:hypothetical protein
MFGEMKKLQVPKDSSGDTFFHEGPPQRFILEL